MVFHRLDRVLPVGKRLWLLSRSLIPSLSPWPIQVLDTPQPIFQILSFMRAEVTYCQMRSLA